MNLHRDVLTYRVQATVSSSSWPSCDETQGWRFFFVSHDLNVVRLLCSRIIVMYLGEVVESGSTECLCKSASSIHASLAFRPSILRFGPIGSREPGWMASRAARSIRTHMPAVFKAVVPASKSGVR